MRYYRKKSVPEEKRIKLSRHKNKIHLKDHAYNRYLERVGAIDRNELEIWCNKQFKLRYWDKPHLSIVEFGGVWWGYDISFDGCLYLTTCLGKGNVDIAAAEAWGLANNDRINLKSLI